MHSKIQQTIKSLARFIIMIGMDPRKILQLRHYPLYRRHIKAFKKMGGEITNRYVILSDFTDQAGSARGHYFHQDLLVASFIYQQNPIRHIDIGSRIDGFVAHVAAFRPVEVFDYRKLEDTGHKNIIFKKADLMSNLELEHEITDSLSCLHVIEHFGLGRYGDPIDPKGHIKGFNNIMNMIKKNGTLYISFPIGARNEVHFNAHRVFTPTEIFSWPQHKQSLRLERFDYVDDNGNLHQNFDIANNQLKVEYGCGIYTLKKLR